MRFSCLVTVGVILGCSQQAGTSPVAVVAVDMDMGEVTPGAKMFKGFAVRNDEQAAWVVGDVTKSCGCAAIKLDTKKVAAGELLTGSVHLAIPAGEGAFLKTVTIAVGTERKVRLNILGTAVAPFSVMRDTLIFRHGESELAVGVRTTGCDVLTVVECCNWCSATIEQAVNGDMATLKLIRNGEVGSGDTWGVVTLGCSSGYRRTVPIRFDVMPRMTITPSLACFGQTKIGDSMFVDVTVNGASDDGIDIVCEALPEAADLDFSWRRTSDTQFVVRATLVGLRRGFLNSTVRVRCGEQSVGFPIVARIE